MGNTSSSLIIPIGDSLQKIPSETNLNGSLVGLLPLEICKKIFAYLNKSDLRKASLICKTFRDYALSDGAWKTVILKEELAPVLQKSKKIVTLNGLRSNQANNVVKLSLSGCDEKILQPQIVKELAVMFPNLQELDMKGVEMKPKQLKEFFAAATFKQSLKILNLFECTQVTDDMVLFISQQFPNIISINLRDCTITDASVKAVCSLVHLEKILLEGIVNIGDENLLHLSTSCTKISHLSIYGGLFLTSKSIDSIVSNLGTNLQELCLTGSDSLDSESLKVLASKCVNLRKLTCDGCKKITDEGVVEIAKSCKMLSSLSLFGCREISDKSLSAIGEHNPEMEKLNFCGCKNISNSGIGSLSSLRKLKIMDLALCSKLSDEILKFIAEAGYKDTLQNLALDYISGISNYGMQYLNKLSSLTTLRLSGCKITDDSFSVFPDLLSRIEVFYLIDCDRISNKTLQVLQENCKRITYINLNYCSLITDDGIENMVKNMPQLRELDIKYCSSLDAVAPTLMKIRPDLQIWYGSTRQFYK